MDTSDRNPAASEKDTIMADESWSSVPLLLDNFIPTMPNHEYPGFWSSSSPFDPYFSEDPIMERNQPQDLLQLSLFDEMVIPTSPCSATMHDLDVEIDSALDWMNVEAPFDSIGGIPEHRPLVDSDELSLAPGALRGSENPTQRARRTTINQRQKEILTDWIARNPEPYPSREEKVSLAIATGLSVHQVSGWFTRTRQRGLSRMRSNAQAPNPSGITTSPMTLELRPNGQPIGLPESLQSSGNPVAFGENPCFSLDHFWSRCTSLPPRSQRRLSGTLKRARSLPHIFTLDIVNPDTSALSQVSQGRMSLDVAAPTHESGDFKGGKLNVEAQPLTCQSVQGLTYPLLKPVSTSTFVKAWIEDVALYGAPIPHDLVEITSIESHDFNASTQGPLVTEESATGFRNSTAYDQEPLRHIQTVPLPIKSADCMNCRAKKIRCDFDTRSGAGCTSCLHWGLVCVSTMGNVTTSQIEAARLLQRGTPLHTPHSQSSNPFDAMSNADSSADSACSAASYMSLGPRKGRRVAFQKYLQEDLDRSLPTPPLHLSRKHSCIYCGEQISKSQMDAHVFEHHVQRYACTFCRRGFGSFYAWKRHEESVHVPQFTWICSPDMMRIETTSSKCPVCMYLRLDMAHSAQLPCVHGFHDCWQKSAIERTFYRLDAFKQHLHTVHFKNRLMDLESIDYHVKIEKCKGRTKAVTPDKLKCQFCGFASETWTGRTRHIARHFENGETMKLWIPGGPYALNMDGSTMNQTSAERHQFNWSRRKAELEKFPAFNVRR
ncbi:hypothetical protein F5Y03DRAFT_351136 [Xylaria venustula]|nr:hypothetical protein F5Y03DRAFT_351136 [Xylaria venustula]